MVSQIDVWEVPRTVLSLEYLPLQAVKLAEECGEVAEAVLAYSTHLNSHKGRQVDMEDVAAELMDVIQVASGMLTYLGDCGLDLQAVQERHMQKMEAKGGLLE